MAKGKAEKEKGDEAWEEDEEGLEKGKGGGKKKKRKKKE